MPVRCLVNVRVLYSYSPTPTIVWILVLLAITRTLRLRDVHSVLTLVLLAHLQTLVRHVLLAILLKESQVPLSIDVSALVVDSGLLLLTRLALSLVHPNSMETVLVNSVSHAIPNVKSVLDH